MDKEIRKHLYVNIEVVKNGYILKFNTLIMVAKDLEELKNLLKDNLEKINKSNLP